MLSQQQECFNNIKTLCSNYKKDSTSRKNEDYLVKRLESLEAQWNDFQIRHQILMETMEDKNINYFKEDVYGNLKELYDSTVANMKDLLQRLPRATLGSPGLDNSVDEDSPAASSLRRSRPVRLRLDPSASFTEAAGLRYCTETVEKCGHCGGPHRQDECEEKRKGMKPVCVNCKNDNHGDTGHNAFSASCPVRRKWDSIARARVAYN
ncbi:hypothetical protein ACJJTC_000018 [Scirpophaga incertulas]